MAILTLALALTVVFRAVRGVKFVASPRRRPLTQNDMVVVALWSAGAGALAHLGGPVLAAPICLVGGGVLGMLWLDALLYRLFSFELGGGGLRGVVLSNLYTEVMRMETSRRFVRRHPVWTMLPLLGGLLHAAALLLPAPAALAAVALVATGLLRELRGDAAALVAPGTGGLLDDLFRDRRPCAAEVELGEEEAAAIARAPAPYRPSGQHGLLAGRSVVVLSFESVARCHLRPFNPEGARADFLAQLVHGSLTTEHTFCTGPLTNVAHLGWYRGQDVGLGPGYLAALGEAGYECAYLTPVATEHYGLGELLTSVGFTSIMDGAEIERECGHTASDRDLAGALARLLARLRRPFYLHVHLANTHIPYRVDDPARFSRFDAGADRGRFLNAVEESDAVLAGLWAQIAAAAPGEAPLLVVTSDHGQSFGEKGYWSHASGLVAEQIDVPLVLCHPRLPAQTVPVSTHHDLLPTILDLLGLCSPHAGYGDSLLHGDRVVDSLLWDGAPTRATAGVVGRLRGREKITLDLVRDECVVSGWCDEAPHRYTGRSRAHAEAVLARLAAARGLP